MANLLLEYPQAIDQNGNQYQSTFLNIFWTGFVIYTVSFTFGTTGTLSHSLIELFQVFGIILFVPASFALIRFRLESTYFKVIYALYCCWLLVVVLRGFTLDYVALKKTLFDPNNSIFLYFVPYIVLFPTKLFHFRKIFTAIAIIGAIYLLYNFIFFQKIILAQAGDESSKDILDYFAKTLSLPAGFLLLTYVYQPKKIILLAGSTILLTFLLAAICGRRGLMFMSGTILLFSFLVYTYENRRQIINVFISVVAVSVVILYTTSMFYDKDVKIFDYTKGRLDEDSRSMVEEFFYDDMETQDWLIGRGMNGLVAAPFSAFMENTEGKPGYREGIETDYLKIILKGGIISLGLKLLISIPAIVLGLFYSRNILSKAAALWILLWLLSLYPSNVTNFTLNYMLVWISIIICHTNTIRNFTEDYLRSFIND